MGLAAWRARSALERMFEPRRVALVGASDKPGKMGSTFMSNLDRFEGELIPVTHSQPEVLGQRAYPTLRDAPGPIDLAIIVVPAHAVPEVLEDAAASGVSSAVVISGGFAEVGREGARLQQAALEAARAGSVRVAGPNCFGILNCHLGLNASMAGGTPRRAGGISLVTQSGAYGMAIYTLSRDDQLGFAKVYAAGNKMDIADTEVLGYLLADEQTEVLCFFLESIEGGRQFCEIARATGRVKPIIVTKTGRSEAGARAAISHTAAIASASGVWEEAFRQAGIVVAKTGQEMMDAAKALAWQPVPLGGRVAVITNSGGTGVELTDLLQAAGLEVPELSLELQASLRTALPAHASTANPVDVTPDWLRFADMYSQCIRRLATSGEIDVIIPILLQRSAVDARVAGAIVGVQDELRRARSDVAVYICWVAPDSARANRETLQRERIPCFDWPERTARAVGLAVEHGRLRKRALPVTPRIAGPPDPLPNGLIDADLARKVLIRGGVSLVDEHFCADLGAIDRLAASLSYPVVAKLLSDEVTHKSDVGGVLTNLGSIEQLRAAAAQILSLPGAKGVVVQPQLSGLEAIVGGLRDAQFGPCVMVGLGGIMVEVLGDVAIRLAPLGLTEAIDALRSLRGRALLEGVRGSEPVHLEALAELVVAVGDLMHCNPHIAELDLNPVIATAHEVVAVDYRLIGGSLTHRG